MAFLQKRIILQLRVFEALMWIGFYLLQAIGISLLIKFFPVPGSPMSVPDHLLFMAAKLFLNIVFYLPCWWFFFYKLRHVSLKNKAVIHLLFAPVFAVAWTAAYTPFMFWCTGTKYNLTAFFWDSYATAIHYILTFAVMHAYNFWLEAKRRFKREQELKDLAHASEMKALKSQIEPHFLFNTLNSISASVPPSLEQTREMVAQLADTFRYALHVSERQWVTVAEEIDFLKTWLTLEEHRFGKRLQVIYDIHADCLRHQIPPMLLQPIIENSLKHGISPKVEGSKVTIRCVMKDDALVVNISDTGVGYKGDLNDMLTQGTGLSNISRRLQLMFNESLYVRRGQQGLIVWFRVPAFLLYQSAGMPLSFQHASGS